MKAEVNYGKAPEKNKLSGKFKTPVIYIYSLGINSQTRKYFKLYKNEHIKAEFEGN